MLGVSRLQGRSKSVPRASPTISFRLRELPRALQEAVRVQDTIRTPFGTHFRTRFGTPGTLKFKEFREIFVKNQGCAIFGLDRFRTPIWDPPGHPFGTFLASKIVENCLEIRLGAPKSRSRAFSIGPGGLQERSKRPTGGQHKGTERATYCQEASRMGPGAFLDRF